VEAEPLGEKAVEILPAEVESDGFVKVTVTVTVRVRFT